VGNLHQRAGNEAITTAVTYLYLEGLLGVEDLFGCSEVDVNGERGFGTNNTVVLAETELFPQ